MLRLSEQKFPWFTRFDIFSTKSLCKIKYFKKLGTTKKFFSWTESLISLELRFFGIPSHQSGLFHFGLDFSFWARFFILRNPQNSWFLSPGWRILNLVIFFSGISQYPGNLCRIHGNRDFYHGDRDSFVICFIPKKATDSQFSFMWLTLKYQN